MSLIKITLLPIRTCIYCYTDTGRDATDYNNYGCWCGVGGAGPILDETDRSVNFM